MHVPSILLTTYAFASLTRAFRLPFAWHLPWAHASDAQQLPLAVVSLVESEEVESTDHLNRIAIIGAGAGGSSAAFFIGKAKERWGLDIEVDLYDANSYIGGSESSWPLRTCSAVLYAVREMSAFFLISSFLTGSTTVHPYSDPRLEPVELGASIFVEANKNLWRASDEFGFERQDFDDPDGSMGLWDGSQFLITVRTTTKKSGEQPTDRVDCRRSPEVSADGGAPSKFYGDTVYKHRVACRLRACNSCLPRSDV